MMLNAKNKTDEINLTCKSYNYENNCFLEPFNFRIYMRLQ
jgi:hypothetical protein